MKEKHPKGKLSALYQTSEHKRMYLTIEQLRNQIQLSRNQLADAAELWLSTQNDTALNLIKDAWLNAIKSPNRDEMQIRLQEGNVPIAREDQLIDSFQVSPLSSEPSSSVSLVLVDAGSEHNQHLRCCYVSLSESPNDHLIRLCYLTTLFEQLYQLEDFLVPMELDVSFRGLKLAEAMGNSMNQEWCFVEKGGETVRCYAQRLEQATDQFKDAKGQTSQAIEMIQAQVEIRTRQFEVTLRHFASIVSEAYSLEQDNRMWLFRKLSAYLPWHDMLNQMINNLFGAAYVSHQEQNSVIIEHSGLEAIGTLVQTENQKPLDEIIKNCDDLSKATDLQLKIFQRKLDMMRGNLEVAEQMGALRHMALFLPSSVSGFHHFFSRLQRLPGLLPARDFASESDNRRVDYGDQDRARSSYQ